MELVIFIVLLAFAFVLYLDLTNIFFPKSNCNAKISFSNGPYPLRSAETINQTIHT